MTHAFTSISLTIADLVDHPANVRINSGETYEPDAIAHLKASIGTLGLLQPLLVQEQDGKYGVLAGRRRQAALLALLADKSVKEFTKKTNIDCRLVPDDCDVTTALSLAENITQVPMNAIDEFEAFARMMEVDGQTPETIASTFGTTVAAVKGRLRYGLIHPDIRAAARAKDITLDAMKAFADHPSQDAQKEVFDALTSEDRYLNAYSVRQALKRRGIQASDELGVLVREEYDARDGAIAADLLEEHSVLEDAALVETILLEKLQQAAEDSRAKFGFAWADATVSYDHEVMSAYGRVYPSQVDMDDEAQARADEIAEEIEALEKEMEDDDMEQDANDALYDRVDALETEIRDLQEAYSTEILERAGVMASWSNNRITLHVGLIRPEDRVAQPGAAGGGNEDSTAGNDDKPASDEIVYSAALQDDFKTERAMALGAAMAMNPEATLDLTLFKLVTDVLHSGMTITYAIKVDARKEYRAHAKMDEIDSTSLEQVAAAHDKLDLDWLDDTRPPAEQFEAFRALAQAEKAKLVAYATAASTTQPCFARHPERDGLMHAFEQEIMPDIRAHWAPNGALFNRFKKAWLLNILSKELGLVQEAVTLASSSKKEIVAFLDKLFAEPFATLTDSQRMAVESWCPPMMQTADVNDVDEDADEVGDGHVEPAEMDQAA
ncbi:ParB N-terminal domain-containing protein [uncultured Tateyamaria sp.]|uniref:ParB/RepB/Spo0J family partition protein n=1 Tax=uncultured Tateyamaria sp. TaxID=455651 RepID=UPI00262C7609|nr:ParB N-terminal domain-containing protein [uncultured Tateyamaria sp.]